MRELETGRNKIQKICDALTKETLEPAKQEAREIVENAHLQAAEILKEAEKKVTHQVAQAERDIEERRKIFNTSLQLACRQGVEQLKQKIEMELFDRTLADVVAKEMSDPKVIAGLIQAMIRSIEEKGVDEDLIAIVSKEVPTRAINALLGSAILQKLQGQGVVVGDFEGGGAQVQCKGRHITIDMSSAAVRELIAEYIRRDFRQMIFNA